MPFASTTDWVRLAARATPEALAVLTSDAELTYAALDELVDRTAAGLERSFGVGPGCRLGVVCAASRRLDTVALLWATWRLGAVAVVIDPADPSYTTRRRSEWGLTEIVTRVDTGATPGAPVMATPDGPSHHTWVPTSGSTAGPRPVILTHDNVGAAVAASQERLRNGAEDLWLLTLPLFHVGGLSVLWRSAAAGGAVVLHDRFDAHEAARAMQTGRVTMASLVPTMLHRILGTEPGPFPWLRAVLLGGAAAPRSLVERAFAAGLPVLATYGMTEACSQVATVAPGEQEASLVSVGRPLDGMSVTIELPNRDGAGEILVDGPAVSSGYAFEAPRSGPLRTGDIGRFDVHGRLVVLGRSDDVIVSGGENVVPSAVEAVLGAHPALAEVAVLGVPDAEWGEIVVAVVVPGEETPTIAELDRFAGRRLAPAQRPRRWHVVDDLPLLPNGKIDRRAVRTETLEGRD